MTIDQNTKIAREKTLATNYLELHKFGQNGDYDRAIKCANRILNVAPQEEKALHCKIICLIQQSKFSDAVQLIQRNASSFTFHFEKAYCQYRLNNTIEALETLEQVELEDFRVKELKAQILYRLEKFDDALQIYKDVIKNNADDYTDERETNVLAVMGQLNNEDKTVVDKLRSDTYELSYNLACLLITQERFIEAEKKLKQCEKMCRESLEEDGALEEEIDSELALVRVQLGYVYQKQGRIKEAQQLYSLALKLKLDDAALVAVASNNSVVINRDQNVFDSRKKIKAATNDALVHKLNSKQRQLIALNHAILMYYTNHFDQCNKLSTGLEETFPNLACQARVVGALSLLRSDNAAAAISLLTSYVPKDDSEKLYVSLAHVHLLLMQGEQLKACHVLENMGDDMYKPGIVGILITLYLGMKNKDTALKIFERTVEWYRKNKVKGDLSNMWRQAADFHMHSGQPKVAANCLEELIKNNQADKKAVAQLVLAYLQFDKKKAGNLIHELPSLQDVPNEGELDTIESSNWLTIKKIVNKAELSPSTPKVEFVNKIKKKNRKRKTKFPKNYDPHATPDPERWMPKHERSGFRKKRDRRMKEIIKGSQGTTSTQSEQFDFSKMAEQEVPSSSPVSSVEPSPKPKPQQLKKGQQKKKGGSKRR